MGAIADSLREVLPSRQDFRDQMLSLECYGPVAVVSDLHIPFINEDLFEYMIAKAKEAGARDLFIVGDLFNMAPYSRHGAGLGSRQEVLRNCRDVGHRVLELAFSHFDTVIVSPGNHDEWMIKHNEGHFGFLDIMRWVWPEGGQYLTGDEWFEFEGQPKRIIVTELPTLEVFVKGTRWVFEHPASFSQVRTKTATTTADKYQCNVAVGHVHHWGLTTDRTGQYLAVELGGMFHDGYFDYIFQKPKNLPRMVAGFAIVTGDEAMMYRA